MDAEQIKSSYYSILKEEKKKEAASQLPPISGGDLALQGLMGPNPSPAAAAIANKIKISKGDFIIAESFLQKIFHFNVTM